MSLPYIECLQGAEASIPVLGWRRVSGDDVVRDERVYCPPLTKDICLYVCRPATGEKDFWVALSSASILVKRKHFGHFLQAFYQPFYYQ